MQTIQQTAWHILIPRISAVGVITVIAIAAATVGVWGVGRRSTQDLGGGGF